MKIETARDLMQLSKFYDVDVVTMAMFDLETFEALKRREGMGDSVRNHT